MAVKKSSEVADEKVPTKKPKKFTDATNVTVISNFSGHLFYRSPRFNDEYEWAEYGDENEMSIQELKSMKASHRRFFEDKWITFTEDDADDIIKHLKIEKYYKDGVAQNDLEDIFDKSVEDIADIIDTATPNEKSLILTKAREKFESGELINTHIIRLIEEKLQVDIDVNNPK
jgi:hypothetical protein